MANCVSFQLSCDRTLNRIFRCFCGKGYIRTLKENLKALKREMEDLKALQHEVQNKVTREEETGHRQGLKAVQVWFERVEKTDKDFNDLLSTSDVELQKLCFCGLCSKNVCSSYKYGKTVFLLLEGVRKLKSEGNFEVATEPTSRSGVEERPTRPTIGHERMLEKASKRLMEDGVGIMGLHGMGGVGKTTLFKKIHNKFKTAKDDQFKIVIWVVVSKGAKISKLQEDIAKRLNLWSEEWTKKVLLGKRFALMLDDIWEEVDLEAVGVPFPTRENKCKIAFTTRLRDVCGRMGDHEPMQVKCLETKEAWELFENLVGAKTLRSDPVIEKLAKKVAEKCDGLPLALNVIGKTMTSKTTIQEWEHAIDVLTRSAARYPDMESKILPILKYSYDNLGDEDIKSCFLYCALFPEDSELPKANLIEYWIGEGFFRDHQDIKRATNVGYGILGTLVRANLLMDVGTSSVVMHDVVREMALWTASYFVVQAKMELYEMPKLKDLGAVRRMSLIENEIQEITWSSNCTELTTLFLQNNNLKNLSGEVIQSMQKLVVLDISGNRDFNKLPEEISTWVSLQFLNLSNTSIEQLPFGFQKWEKLTHLKLNATSRLRSISGISKLSSLRSLDLEESNVHGDIALLKELQLLENLQVLNITISTDFDLEHILRDQRLANCINRLKILGFRLNILLLVCMQNLCYLCVENSQVSEIITDMKCRESTSPFFSNLSSVVINKCSGSRDLTWLLCAPNLVQLKIVDCKELKEIISKRKETNLLNIKTPFQKLEVLVLEKLSELESIYWTPLPFPFLRRLEVLTCKTLRKLPFNASSAPLIQRNDIVIDEYQLNEYEWEEDDEDKHSIYHSVEMSPIDLEWEDEDTANRFWPLINPRPFSRLY